MKKEEERKLARMIVRGIGKEFRSHGFVQSKPTFLVRPFDQFVQFIHFHKFTFAPQFRLHLGIRVLNDPFEAVALNGPSFERAGTFATDERDTLECTHKLISLIEKKGLPWFSALSEEKSLMISENSPLQDRDREALSADLSGKKSDASYTQSERLLGLSREKA